MFDKIIAYESIIFINRASSFLIVSEMMVLIF